MKSEKISGMMPTANISRSKKDNPYGKGRPKKDDPELAIVKAAKAKADEIKGSAYMIKVLCFLFDTKYHMHYIISFLGGIGYLINYIIFYLKYS